MLCFKLIFLGNGHYILKMYRCKNYHRIGSLYTQTIVTLEIKL